MKPPRTPQEEKQLDLIFAALADRTRRAILSALCSGTRTVSELAEPHQMSLPAISKHLKILERAGLVHKEKEGRIFRCDLRPEALTPAGDMITFYQKFWESRFDALADYLAKTQEENPPSMPDNDS
ncbi:metalloregulator ArsR/SmtB family transcription factor [Acanthopleuribacter pedis]|uniref:Winged helix-turn-helix transcriptional regulator n=1 Tax=Acanthopleuribacter pedis TaxID=442870 RepID=A0A8J7QHH7_9BACT|nr:winged helix-turn-helix transcriptional regulator [Acanthopleuribacter pedis]